MDKDKKLQKLNSILQEWLNYSKLYTEVNVEVVSKTNLLTAKYAKVIEYGEEKTIMKSTEYEKIPSTEYVKITYSKPKVGWRGESGFESIEFPLTDIDKRIEHYENKVRNLKSKVDESGRDCKVS